MTQRHHSYQSTMLNTSSSDRIVFHASLDNLKNSFNHGTKPKEIGVKKWRKWRDMGRWTRCWCEESPCVTIICRCSLQRRDLDLSTTNCNRMMLRVPWPPPITGPLEDPGLVFRKRFFPIWVVDQVFPYPTSRKYKGNCKATDVYQKPLTIYQSFFSKKIAWVGTLWRS